MKNKLIAFLPILGLLYVLTCCSSCYYDNKDDLFDVVIVEGEFVPCEFTEVSYAIDVVPILELQCNGACHNSVDRRGNIVLDTHSDILPYLNDGSFIGSIIHTAGFEVMPPGGQKIPDCEIQKLQFWVDNGAPNN